MNYTGIDLLRCDQPRRHRRGNPGTTGAWVEPIRRRRRRRGRIPRSRPAAARRSEPAITRIKEAVWEIKATAKKQPLLGANARDISPLLAFTRS
jgi:hypothetical protein